MTPKKTVRTGRPMNLYMRADDVAKMSQLAAYAASNGHHTSDSMIVRAALRVAGVNREFLWALKDAKAGT